jgi:hypothetical protein
MITSIQVMQKLRIVFSIGSLSSTELNRPTKWQLQSKAIWSIVLSDRRCFLAEYAITWRTIRARIFKRLWSPGIDSKASIPPSYVAWRAGTITLFLLGA